MTRSKTKDAPPNPVDRILSMLIGKAGLLTWRLLVLILLALGYFEGKNMGHAFIATAPAVTTNAEEIKKAKADIENNKAAALAAVAIASKAADQATQIAAAANTKADAQAAAQAATATRLFDAIRQNADATQKIVVSIATLTEHVAGLEKTVDRVEAKQDAK